MSLHKRHAGPPVLRFESHSRPDTRKTSEIPSFERTEKVEDHRGVQDTDTVVVRLKREGVTHRKGTHRETQEKNVPVDGF